MLRILGAGAGLVLAVEHARSGRRRSMWILPRGPDARVTAARAPRHPRLAELCGAGRTAMHAPFLLFESLDGDLLSERLRNGERLSLTRAIELGACLFEALGALHAAGLCHGEVSGAVVIALRDGGAKLLCATPQPASQRVARTDVERAARVLFEAITGRPAPAGTPSRLEQAVASMPPEVRSLVLDLCSENPPVAPIAAARLRRLLLRRPMTPAPEGPTRRAPYQDPTISVDDDAPTRCMPRPFVLKGARMLSEDALEGPTRVDPPRFAKARIHDLSARDLDVTRCEALSFDTTTLELVRRRSKKRQSGLLLILTSAVITFVLTSVIAVLLALRLA